MFSMISWYDAGICRVLCSFLHYSASNSQCLYAMAFSITLFAQFFCCVSQSTTTPHCIVVRKFAIKSVFAFCERWKSDLNLEMLWQLNVITFWTSISSHRFVDPLTIFQISTFTVNIIIDDNTTSLATRFEWRFFCMSFLTLNVFFNDNKWYNVTCTFVYWYGSEAWKSN